jgi:hypothetical protein
MDNIYTKFQENCSADSEVEKRTDRHTHAQNSEIISLLSFFKEGKWTRKGY